MASDARINIDVLLQNLSQFKSDVQLVNDLLSQVGNGVGEDMEASFSEATGGMTEDAKQTEQEIDSALSKDVTTNLNADTEDATTGADEVKGKYEELPDEESTSLEANTEDAESGIGDVKSGYESLPDSETTNLEANADDAKEDIGSVKSGYNSIPDEESTNINANAEDAKEDIGSVKSGYNSIPDQKSTNINANAEDAKEDIGSVKGGYSSIPDQKTTNIQANAEDAKEDIGSVKSGYNSIPDSKGTTITANTQAAEDNLGSLNGSIDETGSKMMSLKDKLSIGAIAGAASAGFQKIVGSMDELIQGTMLASDALLGFESTMDFAGFGADKIQKIEKSMKSYADNTVYDLETVSNTTAQLGANGVKDFEKLMEASGNLNAVAGGTSDSFDSLSMMMTQTAGAGKLTTENWNQLADAIPGASKKMQDAMKENGAYTGNFREAMEEGEISADEFFEAVMQLGDTEKAAEYAEGTSAYEGAIGNLKSAMQNGLLEMEEAIGKENITDIINNMADVAERAFKRIGDAVSFLVEHKEGVKIFADGILALLAAFSTYKVITGFTKAIEALTIAMSLNPMALFIAAIVGVIVAFTALYKNSEGFRNFVDGIIEGAKEVYDNVVGWFKKLPGRISETWNNLSEGVSEGWSSFVETLSEWAHKAWSTVKKPFVSVGHWFSNIWHTISKGASDGWETITETLSEWVGSAWRAIKKPFVAVGNWFSNIWHTISKGAKKGWNAIKKVVKAGAKAAKYVALAPFIILAATFITIWDAIKKPTKKLWNWMKKHIGGAAKSIYKGAKKQFNKLKNAISNIWNGIKKVTHKIWTPIKNFVVNTAIKIYKTARKWFMKLKHAVHSIWNGIKKVTHKIWSPIKNFVVNTAIRIYKTVRKWFMKLRRTIHGIWNGIKKITVKVWNSTGGWLIDKAHNIWKGVKKKFNNLKDNLADIMKGIKSGWKSTWNSISDFFGDIWGTIKKNAKDGINGVVGWLNKGIGGINSVIHTFGGKKEAIKPIATLAKGGSHRGIAQVNDGNGEEVILKQGKPYKVSGRNALVQLDGSETVVPHEASRATFGDSIKRYASGSKGWFSKLTGWVKDKWDGITEFIKHPIKSLKTIMTNKIGDITGSEFIRKFTPPMITGFINAIKDKFKSVLKGLQEDHEDGGSFDGKMGAHGVYAYLWNIAKKVMKKFPGMTYTSGYRPGDPHHHGKHQAVDIAYPASSNGSRKYFRPANYAFNEFPKKIAYVITQGKVKDRVGSSGHGPSKNWMNWGSHDHDDHLHLSGKYGPKNIGQISGSKGPKPKGGHKGWMRQAGFKPSEYTAINSIIRRESGWNPRAINPSSGAYGLPQSLPGSKMKSAGSDWRSNPVTQLKWMRKYVNGRYGGAQKALAWWNSHHWYANGGEVNKPTLAYLGEDPSASHEFIINPKKDSADALIAKAIASREQFKPAASTNVDRYVATGNQNNNAPAEPQKVTVEVPVYMDKKQIGFATAEYSEQKNKQRRKIENRKLGGGNSNVVFD